MNQFNINKHKKNGVNIVDINNVYVDDDVKIGKGTTVEPGVHIKNGAQIGKNVIIRPNSQISNSIIGDN
ncbi:MAG: bifunctional UDP-N-acetylglucosamine diphosphorylase/glucosamine-1-phosphate N-acetyltransferase GlmU, partial [Dehalococcoidia bacterium]|nr:bifunctional UDP-N-acetylglucosamine diphosphorylase/glucosamine-1-phosphate N-acetyltransferase GlmU [Dehalococcoidia bacterium]